MLQLASWNKLTASNNGELHHFFPHQWVGDSLLDDCSGFDANETDHDGKGQLVPCQVIGNAMPDRESDQQRTKNCPRNHRCGDRFVGRIDSVHNKSHGEEHGKIVTLGGSVRKEKKRRFRRRDLLIRTPLRVILQTGMEDRAPKPDTQEANVGEISQDGILPLAICSNAIDGIDD